MSVLTKAADLLPEFDPAHALKAAVIVGAATCSVLLTLADHEVIELGDEAKRFVAKVGASLGTSLMVHKALTHLEQKRC